MQNTCQQMRICWHNADFLFSRSAPGTREAHLERPQGFWNGLRLLEQSLGSTWNRPLGYLCIVRWQDGINPYIISVLIRPPASVTPFAACGTACRAIQQTFRLFRDNRWSGIRLRRGGLSSRLGHRLRRELRRLCESLWGLDARGNTG